MMSAIIPGTRVEVSFRNKTYTGIVAKTHENAPQGYTVKPILSLPDHLHVVNKMQLEFWDWMAGYYMCSVGDVMNAALPAPYKLSSETLIVLEDNVNVDAAKLDDKEFLVAEALTIQKELSLKNIQDILQQKTIQPVIKSLIQKGIIYVKEELKETYAPKKEKFIYLRKEFRSEEKIKELFELLDKYPKQVHLLMIWYQLSQREGGKIKKSTLLKKADATPAVLKTMLKNEIFYEQEEEVSRLPEYFESPDYQLQLSEMQTTAIREIREQFVEKNTVLLHGVTGSGKTEIYIEMMKEYVAQGKQVLYLLPEIALTAQIINRLRKNFGQAIGVYHSKFSQNERIETWTKVLNGEYKIILGARSSVFLPFNELGMVIIDEEHDYSYKQQDPNPRYHGRDAAIYLAYLHHAKTLLGTATPSVETYFLAKTKKFGLVNLYDRYSGMQMPDIQIVNIKEETDKKLMQSHFSSVLIDKMKYALQLKEQVILFQNRRGYAPYLFCESCGWVPRCVNCDVNLVYHKYSDELRCHYCNYKQNTYQACPACGSSRIIIKGFGTEKIEDELHYILPEARIGRLDLDAVKTKHGHEKVIQEFENGEIDILVGTQMVTKGLDFDHVNLVGILSADQILNFSDYRAAERGFQMITQVSGRAGRKNKKGLVIIQALQFNHPVLRYVIEHNYNGFYETEIQQRENFSYPPFVRLIQLTLKHKSIDVVNKTAFHLANQLKKTLGNNLLGPAVPPIPRIKNKYLSEILIKVDNQATAIKRAKSFIRSELQKLDKDPLFKRVEIVTDVDPM